jgi:hypothetical protein
VTRAAVSVMEKTQTYSSAGIKPPGKGHHFLHIDDFSKEELWAMLQTAMKVSTLPAVFLSLRQSSRLCIRYIIIVS